MWNKNSIKTKFGVNIKGNLMETQQVRWSDQIQHVDRQTRLNKLKHNKASKPVLLRLYKDPSANPNV